MLRSIITEYLQLLKNYTAICHKRRKEEYDVQVEHVSLLQG